MTITRRLIFTPSMASSKRISALTRSKSSRGNFLDRALELVLDWAELHGNELRENWDRGRRHERILPIQPLE
jgi:hypothetical protein